MFTFVMFWFAKGIAVLMWFFLAAVVVVVAVLLTALYAHIRCWLCRHDYQVRDKFPHVKSDSLKETKCTKCGKVKP